MYRHVIYHIPAVKDLRSTVRLRISLSPITNHRRQIINLGPKSPRNRIIVQDIIHISESKSINVDAIGAAGPTARCSAGRGGILCAWYRLVTGVARVNIHCSSVAGVGSGRRTSALASSRTGTDEAPRYDWGPGYRTLFVESCSQCGLQIIH